MFSKNKLIATSTTLVAITITYFHVAKVASNHQMEAGLLTDTQTGTQKTPKIPKTSSARLIFRFTGLDERWPAFRRWRSEGRVFGRVLLDRPDVEGRGWKPSPGPRVVLDWHQLGNFSDTEWMLPEWNEFQLEWAAVDERTGRALNGTGRGIWRAALTFAKDFLDRGGGDFGFRVRLLRVKKFFEENQKLAAMGKAPSWPPGPPKKFLVALALKGGKPPMEEEEEREQESDRSESGGGVRGRIRQALNTAWEYCPSVRQYCPTLPTLPTVPEYPTIPSGLLSWRPPRWRSENATVSVENPDKDQKEQPKNANSTANSPPSTTNPPPFENGKDDITKDDGEEVFHPLICVDLVRNVRDRVRQHRDPFFYEQRDSRKGEHRLVFIVQVDESRRNGGVDKGKNQKKMDEQKMELEADYKDREQCFGNSS